MITDTEHPSERVRPSFIEPMQLALVRNLPDGGNWIYEAKLDGYRCLAANRFGNSYDLSLIHIAAKLVANEL